MKRALKSAKLFLASLFPAMMLLSCESVTDNNLPSLPVNINLSTIDMWNTYGVTGFGQYRRFIASQGEPRNFPYSVSTATGFGGVLLISAFNPYTLESCVPMAYDLACPVERDAKVRISVQTDGLLPFAVCPKCGSHYDICERGGVATEGTAQSQKLSLKRYECYATTYGGYVITN